MMLPQERDLFVGFACIIIAGFGVPILWGALTLAEKAIHWAVDKLERRK